MAAIARAPRNVFNLNPFLIGTVITSWALTVVFAAGGNAHIVSHDALLDAGAIPALGSLLLFLAAWQVMTAAMMLPSSMPMIGLFAHVSGRQQRPRIALAVFLAAYFVVWTGFAVVALMSDAGLHRLVENSAWLDRHDYLIPGIVFVLAGAFQFSSLKERCLDACRSPVGFLFRYYQRGPKAAWNLGIRHGLFCLGCCWALMLIMFAVGVGSLIGMAALTGIMVIEKTSRYGRRLASIVGVVLLLWGGLVLAQPNWLPATLASSNQTNEHQHEQAPADQHLQQHDQLPAQPQVPHH